MPEFVTQEDFDQVVGDLQRTTLRLTQLKAVVEAVVRSVPMPVETRQLLTEAVEGIGARVVRAETQQGIHPDLLERMYSKS